MPIYMEISRLHRTVTIVARGQLMPDEIMGAAKQLFEAPGPAVRQAGRRIRRERGGETRAGRSESRTCSAAAPDVKRGPVAFLVNPDRGQFARAFAATQGERPVSVFKSLREARAWLAGIDEDQRRADAGPYESSPWSDPQREAVMFRRGQRRELPIRQSRPSYAA